jgi:thiol:disulfide interchange protein DsbC
MKRVIHAAMAAIALSAASNTLAQPTVSGAAAITLEQLQAKYPNTTFEWVKPTPMPGVAEIKMGKNFAYVDASGQYFLFGHLFDMQTRTDLTQVAIDEASAKVSWADLPREDAIVFGKDSAKHRVAVFTDPDCPFCRRIESELSKLQEQDVQVFVYPYPIAQLHPAASNVAKRIWCSDDRAAAWRAYLLNRVRPSANADCVGASAIERNVALAERYSIVATPTLIASDGRMNAGAASATELLAWLDKGRRQEASK